MSSSCFIPFTAFFQGDMLGKLSGEFSDDYSARSEHALKRVQRMLTAV